MFVDYANEIEKESKPTHRYLYDVLYVERKAADECIYNFLEKFKIRIIK